MIESLEQFTSAELATMCNLETIEQYQCRIEKLESLLRYVLNEGMTKEAYKRIGEALQHIM